MRNLLSGILLLGILIVLGFNYSSNTISINLHIQQVKNARAPIRIAMYRSIDKFPKENGYYKAFVFTPNATGEVQYTIQEVEPGDYAFAFFQDLNANGKLGTNIFGYPNEPFCFSNNVKPLFSAPDFSDCKMSLNAQNKDVFVRLIH